jgi:hypothetical protein
MGLSQPQPTVIHTPTDFPDRRDGDTAQYMRDRCLLSQDIFAFRKFTLVSAQPVATHDKDFIAEYILRAPRFVPWRLS